MVKKITKIKSKYVYKNKKDSSDVSYISSSDNDSNNEKSKVLEKDSKKNTIKKVSNDVDYISSSGGSDDESGESDDSSSDESSEKDELSSEENTDRLDSNISGGSISNNNEHLPPSSINTSDINMISESS